MLKKIKNILVRRIYHNAQKIVKNWLRLKNLTAYFLQMKTLLAIKTGSN